MTKIMTEDLERELQDPEFRKLYGAADAKAELSIALALARQKSGLTQKQLAERLGVKQPYIAKLEGGEANPTIGAVGSMLALINLRMCMATDKLFEPKAAIIRPLTGPYVPAVADASSSAITGEWTVDTTRGQGAPYSLMGVFAGTAST